MSQAFPTRRRGTARRLISVATLLLATSSLASCKKQAESPQDSWSDLREAATQSDDAASVSNWLLAELLRPGGTAAGVKKARAQLDSIGAQSVLANVARGLDDEAHGQTARALEHYFLALDAANSWDDPRASLFAWYAAVKVDELSGSDDKFGPKHRKDVQALLQAPKQIGFRAYAKVVELWAEDALNEAVEKIDAKLARKLGCAENISLAGPFGTNSGSDILRSYPAEAPGPWAVAFDKEKGQPSTPRQLKSNQIGCDVASDEPTFPGIFYGQTFIELEEERDLILSATGATHLWVNDSLVLHRDVRQWGVWPKFGVRLKLPAGRHRVQWKFGDAVSALRIVQPDGKPAQVTTSTNDLAGYSLVPPTVGADPNDLMRYIHPRGVKDPGDEITRYIAAYMANDEGQADVAAVLFEPFVEDAKEATGLALSTSAQFVQADPIYEQTQTRDLVHELELRAAERDPGLWYPQFRNIVWIAAQKGPTTIIDDLEKLARQFPEVRSIHFTLAQLFENLNWGPEYEKTVLDIVARFPNEPEAIKLGIDHFESEGQSKKVDKLLARLRKLDPDDELFITRALNQEDYPSALKELRKLSARRPSRKDIAPRIENILIRSGDKEHTLSRLQKAVEREPRDVHARLALADAQLAKGSNNALPTALVNAVQAGADPSIIEGAIDLMEGLTALESYRIDGPQVIAAYEAKGEHLPGTAVRVLDYGAVWVRGDGFSRFLEHEIVRIQSEEGIKRFAETSTSGLILHLRVIKRNGKILEPEAVAGKSTVTMPHLELGDYIETERIVSNWGDGIGDIYAGPGWFFREQNVAYARSEFVVIAPAEKELILETHNQVPAPQITRSGSLVVYRYRVDKSPAAPVEPNSPPPEEFLPRVSVGWGLDFDLRLRNMSRDMTSLTATDPRLVRIAEKITDGLITETDKVRALYHWVLDSVQDGKETDGRRVVLSRNGNRQRAFQTLCQALDIPVRWAVAESRLSAPLDGPIASAVRPLLHLLVVGEKSKRTWLTIDNQYAPFGTVPSHIRGEKAYILGASEAEHTRVPTQGSEDGIRYEGTGKLSKNGKAQLDLRIVFMGTFATSLRNGLAQIPENQLENIIESRLLGQYLQGAQLKEFKVINKDDLDKPLTISVKTNVPQFATPSSVGLLISPPFMPRLTGLTPLARRATPLLIGQESKQVLDLKLSLPAGMKANVNQKKAATELSSFNVKDAASEGSLHLSRTIVTRAGRVPVDKYAGFQDYANQADTALSRAIRLK